MTARWWPTRYSSDAAQGDFHLKPGSPATRIGFKPFDYTQAGVYGSAQWKELAGARTYPEVQFAPEPPPPPPLEFRQDFELSAPGSGPADAAPERRRQRGRHWRDRRDRRFGKAEPENH